MNKFIIGLMLALPIALLAVFTVHSIRSESEQGRRKKISPDTLNLVTPAETSDEIAGYIESDDYETALVRMQEVLKDPNIPTTYGTPLLVVAAEKNNYDLAKALLERGADANFADVQTGETALIKAAKNQNLELARLLAQYNADTNAQSKLGITPLTAAADKQDAAFTNYLMGRGARAGATQENLLNYTFKRNFTGVEAMLKTGIDPNYTDKNGNTPLIVAASYGDLKSVQALLAYRANINAANNMGMTALLFAVQAKRDEVVKYLLDRGADVNMANANGETPLFWAAYFGKKDLVNDLLILNADYNRKTNKGITPLMAAQRAKQAETVKVIQDFIAYKNIPRDAKGNPIIPKKSNNNEGRAVALTNDEAEAAGVDTTNTPPVNKRGGGVQREGGMPVNPEAFGVSIPPSNMPAGAYPQAVGAKPQAGQAEAYPAGVPQIMMPYGANLPAGFDPTKYQQMMQQQGAPQQPAAPSAMQPKDLRQESQRPASGATQVNKLRTSTL